MKQMREIRSFMAPLMFTVEGRHLVQTLKLTHDFTIMNIEVELVDPTTWVKNRWAWERFYPAWRFLRNSATVSMKLGRAPLTMDPFPIGVALRHYNHNVPRPVAMHVPIWLEEGKTLECSIALDRMRRPAYSMKFALVFSGWTVKDV